MLGGKRPAAQGSPRRGAPKGNLNALKTGRHSRQLLALTEVLLASPAMRPILLRMLEQKKRGGPPARPGTLQNASNDMARRIIRRSIAKNALPQIRKARVFRKQ
jgi:hypothetical protein